MKLELINETPWSFVPSVIEFQQWINAVEKQLAVPEKSICITIVEEDESQTLNHTYRQKNYPTNVLSFQYETPPGFNAETLGDLAICATIVKKEAETQQKTIIEHFAHMTIHGVLHLLGYDHVEEADALKMEALEITILEKLGFKNPYEAPNE